MPDPGTVLGAASLTFQVFAGCIKAFIVLTDARNHGKDATFLQTILNFEENRFALWSRKVGLLSNPAIIDPRINWAIASDLLKQLEHLMSTNNLKQRYRLELHENTAAISLHQTSVSGENDSAQKLLSAIMTNDEKRDVLLRAKLLGQANLWPKKLWWAMVDKQRFEKMVQDVRVIVDGLWVLLSDMQQNESQTLLRQILANSIQASRNLEELLAWKATVDAAPTHSAGHTLISAAASLRSVALRLKVDVSNENGKFNIGQHYVNTGSSDLEDRSGRSAIIQTDMSPAKLKQNTVEQSRSETSNQFVALYDGHAVFAESKPVTAKMKGPLRKRVEDIVTMLAYQQPADFCTLHALGFIEDGTGFHIIYEYPNASVFTTPDLQGELAPPSLPHTLLDLFDIVKRPPLEARMELAIKICRTVLTFHVAGWLHKGLRSNNILFFPTSADAGLEGALRHPYLAGFNFSRPNQESEISEDIPAAPSIDIYRHPDCTGEPTWRYARYMDMYGLATLLIEIGEWYPLRKLVVSVCDISKRSAQDHSGSVASLFGPIQPYLVKTFVTKRNAAFRMGSLYGRLVELCLMAKEDQMDDGQALETFHKALIELENSVRVG